MRQTFTLFSLALLGSGSGVHALPSGGNHPHKRSYNSNAQQTLAIPETKPSGAPVVPADFLGLNIESAFLNNYAKPLSQNLVSSLASRMGAKPIVRVGGTGGDEFVFDPNQTDHIKICCPTGSAAAFKVGPAFFEGYKAFPDAKMTIQAPLGPNVNKTLVREFVRRAWDARIGESGDVDWKDRIEAIALGNEPEFYTKDVEKYVRDTLELEEIVLDELKLEGADRKIFEVGNNAKQPVSQYDVAGILKHGMNKNKLTKITAEHLYQIDTQETWDDANMQKLMLNHQAITSRLDTEYMPSLRASHAAGIPYAISETAAVLASPINTFVSGFGFALWIVDFSLANAARGVARVNHMAGRPVANHVLWVPDHTAGLRNPGPQARAPFAAAIMVADFLRPLTGVASGGGYAAGVDDADKQNANGPFSVLDKDSEGEVAVHEIDLDTAANPYLSAYAAYSGASSHGNNGNKLQRVALINMRLYNGTAAAEQGTKRGSETFRIPVGSGVDEVEVRRLHADLGAAAMGFDHSGPEHNATWAGEQWSKKVDDGRGHFTHGAAEEVQKVRVRDGVAVVEVPDSEAVMVSV
ncbi:glycoside hydrolase family 79 protein [Apiospora saccharicola]